MSKGEINCVVRYQCFSDISGWSHVKMCTCLYMFIDLYFRVKTLMLDDIDKYEHGMSSVHAYITDTIFSREYRVDKSIGE